MYNPSIYFLKPMTEYAIILDIAATLQQQIARLSAENT